MRLARGATCGAAGNSAGPIRRGHPGDCGACVEHLRPEQLPPCVLAFARQVRQLQAIVRDRGKGLEAVEEGGEHDRRQPDRRGTVLLWLAETPRRASCGPLSCSVTRDDGLRGRPALL
jgi:hypothetical protein